MSVIMMIAQPRECPGIQVRSATKRLYIGSYTSVVSVDRTDPGIPRLNHIVRSPHDVLRLMIYFHGCAAKTR